MYNKRPNSEREKKVDLEGYIVADTEKAYLIAVDNDSKNEQWFPKSQLTDVAIKNDEITAQIPLWIAEERKLV